MNTLLVSSSLFPSEPEGDFTYCNGQPGSAFSGWLKSVMSERGWECGELIQEDYGWGFWVNFEKDNVWVCVSFVPSENKQSQSEWCVTAKHEIPFLILQPWLWGNKTGKKLENQIFENLKELISRNSSISILQAE